MRPRGRRIALLAALLAGSALAAPRTVHAYPPVGPYASISSGCSSASPGQSCAISFCAYDSSGAPEQGQTAHFSSSSSNVGKVKPSSASTGSDGCVSGVSFVAGPGCGSVTLTGATKDATAQTQVNVDCGSGGRGGGGGGAGGNGKGGGAAASGGVQGASVGGATIVGLPVTSMLRPSGPPAWLVALLGLLSLGLGAGGTAVLVRSRRGRASEPAR